MAIENYYHFVLTSSHGGGRYAEQRRLGNLESAVKRLVASGRYNSKSEVIREGIRLVEEREKKLAALDAALARGVAGRGIRPCPSRRRSVR